MDKQTLRKTYLEKRQTLTEREFNRRNTLLFTQVQYRVKELGGPVHIFLPIKKFMEVNTWPMIYWMWENSITTLTSITEIKSHQLKHVIIDSDTQLKEDKWDIPTPINGTIVDPNQCQIVFVPLVIADKKGARIGYGKGFYDGFLQRLPERTIKIGLSMAPLLDEISCIERHDIQLDEILFPSNKSNNSG